MHAIRIHELGGPEVLRFEEVAEPGPGAGRGARPADRDRRQLHRRLLPDRPLQAAGAAVHARAGGGGRRRGGRRPASPRCGRAIASPTRRPSAGYAEARLVPAGRLVKVPAGHRRQDAAAMMLKGMTAEVLLLRCARVGAGTRSCSTPPRAASAASPASGRGTSARTVIGTVSSEAKAELASSHGCRHPVVVPRDSFVQAVKELTHGEGVPVVYDSVGADTWDGSLDCLRPLGLMVSYGNASGPVPPFPPSLLAAKGVALPHAATLMIYTARREDLLATAADLFDVVRSGAVRVEVRQRYPLADAARAHADLEGRRTTGSSLLLP